MTTYLQCLTFSWEKEFSAILNSLKLMDSARVRAWACRRLMHELTLWILNLDVGYYTPAKTSACRKHTLPIKKCGGKIYIV